MPSSGENFSGVSHLLMALGRNGVHSELRKAVLAAYDTKPKASNTALAFDASSLPLSFYPNSTRQNMDRKLRTLALSIKKNWLRHDDHHHAEFLYDKPKSD